MLSFSITIGPNHEHVDRSGSHFNVSDKFVYSLWMLDLYRGVEKLEWIAGIPLSMGFWKVEFGDVASNICYNKIRVGVRIVKAVVFCSTESLLQSSKKG